MQYHGLGNHLGETLTLSSIMSGVEPSIIHSRIGDNVDNMHNNVVINGMLIVRAI